MKYHDFFAPRFHKIELIWVHAIEDGIRSHLEFGNPESIIVIPTSPPITSGMLLGDDLNRGVFGYVSFGYYPDKTWQGDLIQNGHFDEGEFINWVWTRYMPRSERADFVRLWCREGVELRAYIHIVDVRAPAGAIMGPEGWYNPDPPSP